MKMLSPFSLSLVAVLSLAAPVYGQAIVGYGINVGRAGAAGAASGAGAAGVLGALKGTLEKSEKNQTGARQATTAESQQQQEKDQESKSTAESKATTAEQEDSETSHSMRTTSGVVISGLPSRRSGSKYGRPAPMPAVSGQSAPPAPRAAAHKGNHSDSVSEGSSQPTSSASAAPVAHVSSINALKNGVVEPIVASTDGSDSTGSNVEKKPSDHQETLEDLKISIGTPIEELVERFGKPLVSLTGIAGQEYTEKYVFQTPAGSRITVLSYEGKVTSVVAEELTARVTQSSL